MKKAYPKKQIIHILVSEEGLIKSKTTNFSMSLKELDNFLKTGKYKRVPSKFDKDSYSKLAIKIRKEYYKKCR